MIQGGEERIYCLNAAALTLMAQMGLSARKRQQLAALQEERVWEEEVFLALLAEHVPDLGPHQRRQVLDAGADRGLSGRCAWRRGRHLAFALG